MTASNHSQFTQSLHSCQADEVTVSGRFHLQSVQPNYALVASSDGCKPNWSTLPSGKWSSSK
eukprot:5506960-Amphidinium_carterae.2